MATEQKSIEEGEVEAKETTVEMELLKGQGVSIYLVMCQKQVFICSGTFQKF